MLRLATLVTFAGGAANFVVHNELHQLQPRLTHQVADAFLQCGGNFLERQVQPQLLLAFFGLLTESADRALAVHLVSFLHSDSPFSLKRISQPEPIDSGRRVATFYGLSDILRRDTPCHSPSYVTIHVTIR